MKSRRGLSRRIWNSLAGHELLHQRLVGDRKQVAGRRLEQSWRANDCSRASCSSCSASLDPAAGVDPAPRCRWRRVSEAGWRPHLVGFIVIDLLLDDTVRRFSIFPRERKLGSFWQSHDFSNSSITCPRRAGVNFVYAQTVFFFRIETDASLSFLVLG